MKKWERATAEFKLQQHRDLRLALLAKAASIQQRLAANEQKIAEWQRRVDEEDEDD